MGNFPNGTWNGAGEIRALVSQGAPGDALERNVLRE